MKKVMVSIIFAVLSTSAFAMSCKTDFDPWFGVCELKWDPTTGEFDKKCF